MPIVRSTALTHLFTVLSTIGQIEQPLVHVSKRGLARVSLCWRFRQPQPTAEGRLRAGIRLFAGELDWNLELRAYEYCIIAAPRVSGYRPLPLLEESGNTTVETFQERILSQIFTEVDKMADHLAKVLHAQEGLEQQQPEFAIIYNEGSEVDSKDDIHFVAWAVSDRQQFWNQGKPWSERGRKLDLGLTYGEWDQFIAELRKRPSNRPLLFRFEDPYTDALFEPSELSGLIQECLSARAEITEPAALRFLQKVRAASEEAAAGQMALYYLAP